MTSGLQKGLVTHLFQSALSSHQGYSELYKGYKMEQISGSRGFLGQDYSLPSVEGIWDIWGSDYNMPKAMFYLIKATIRPYN